MRAIKWIGGIIAVLLLLFLAASLAVGTKPDEDFMSKELAEIERYFEYRDLSNSKISSADVAWQLDHSLKSIIGISETLEKSDPVDYRLNFNFFRTIFFTYGDFPRGVAQAPASVTPPDTITNDALIDQLTAAQEKVQSIQNLDADASFVHDTFGLLDRDEAARLMEVHTEHHLKIVRDILDAEGVSRH